MEDLGRFELNEASILCWMFNMRVHKGQSKNVFGRKLGIRIKCSVQERRLSRYGHVMHMDKDNFMNKSR